MSYPAASSLPRQHATALVALLRVPATALERTDVAVAHTLDERFGFDGADDPVSTAGLHTDTPHTLLTPAESTKAEPTP